MPRYGGKRRDVHVSLLCALCQSSRYVQRIWDALQAQIKERRITDCAIWRNVRCGHRKCVRFLASVSAAMAVRPWSLYINDWIDKERQQRKRDVGGFHHNRALGGGDRNQTMEESTQRVS